MKHLKFLTLVVPLIIGSSSVSFATNHGDEIDFPDDPRGPTITIIVPRIEIAEEEQSVRLPRSAGPATFAEALRTLGRRSMGEYLTDIASVARKVRLLTDIVRR